MSFPRYSKYKDSGVEWLGEVPEGWEVKPVKNVASIVNGYPFDSKLFDQSQGFPLIRIRDLNKAETETFYQGDFVESAAITPADVLIGMDGDFNVGRWRGEGQGLLNQRMCCVRGNTELLTILLEYALPIPLKAINEVTYSTTVKHLSSSQIAKTFIAIPRLESEQHAIATFLDRETAKIDALVAEQENLIALLKEKRQAVISHAVTKGLDPTVPMKDSGIEWLGEVPAHWDLRRISSLSREGGDTFIDGDWIESPYITDEGIRLIQTGNIGVGIYKEQGFRYVTHETFEKLNCTEVDPGDVLICRLAEPVGRACVAPDLGVRMITSVDVCILKPSPSTLATFCVYLFSTAHYLGFMESQCRGGTRDRVSRSFLGAVRIAVPNYQEQQAIAAFLDTEIAKLDDLTTEAQHTIDLLKERRSALISAAVTGKIDVRGLMTKEAA